VNHPVKPGRWVQVEATLLTPDGRAPGLPDDTSSVPLVMRVKGHLREEASLGQEVSVETAIGRIVRGRLVEVDPTYRHDFGRPVLELLQVGHNARILLKESKSRG